MKENIYILIAINIILSIILVSIWLNLNKRIQEIDAKMNSSKNELKIEQSEGNKDLNIRIDKIERRLMKYDSLYIGDLELMEDITIFGK